MPALQVKFDLLEQSAAIESAICRGGEFIQQGIHGGSARAVAARGCKVEIHHLLGLDDGAGMVRARKAHEMADRFVYVVHTRRTAAPR